MLARAAGVSRHRVLRVVAVLVVVAYPFWANPVRVNADPNGWRPVFPADFTDPAAFFAVCTKADRPTDWGRLQPAEASVADRQLRLGVSRNGNSYDLGGVDCDGLAQKYGKYELQVKLPTVAGISLVMELHGTNPAETSRVQVSPVPGAVIVHIVNGLSQPADVQQFASSSARTYRIEWTPGDFEVLDDDNKVVFHDSKPSAAPRVLSVFTTAVDAKGRQPDPNAALPASFQVTGLHVWAYDPAGSASPAVAQPSPSATVGHGGPSWWLIGAVVAAVAVITLVVVAVKRRDPRKLRPGHRK